MLELAAELKQRGENLLDHLDRLHARHGIHVEQTVSIMAPGPTGRARVARIMQALRTAPVCAMGPAVWNSVRDYERHEVRSLPENTKSADLPSPVSDLLIFEGRATLPLDETAGECEVTLAVRPSGTEPKIKCYGFVRTDASPNLAADKRRAHDCLVAAMEAVQSWIASVP